MPADLGGLAVAIGETHKRYTREVNRRQSWVGHLWQGRFASCPMDEPHALMAARYIERNPDRARLVLRPEDWRWSSARAHLEGIDDGLTRRGALEALVADWRAYLDDTPPSWQADRLRFPDRCRLTKVVPEVSVRRGGPADRTRPDTPSEITHQ